MKFRFFEKTIVALLSFVLVTPMAFFVVPEKTSAEGLKVEMSGVKTGNTGENGGVGAASNFLSVNPTTGNLEGGSGNNVSVGGGEAGCLSTIGAAVSAVAVEMGISSSPGTPRGASVGQTILSVGQCVTSTLALIKQAISTVSGVSQEAAAWAIVINMNVLQPLAFILSGKLLKTLTAAVIAFAIGKANGTGLPQFAADIQASLRTAGDARTLAFLNSYMRSSQSPYSGSIVAALRRDYFNETSLAGFWAANMDTLRATSPNPYGYLSGNWALGGVSAWFALTTQDNNNPYMLYLNGRSTLSSVVGVDPNPGIIGKKVAEIQANNGFSSWCGASDGFLGTMPNGAASASATAIQESNASAYTEAYNEAHNSFLTAHPANNTAAEIIAENNPGTVVPVPNIGRTASLEVYAAATAAGRAAGEAAEASMKTATIEALKSQVQSTNPGDPCINSDGTSGVVKTPGSVIAASLNKVLGGEQDNIVRMGNVGPEITSILGNIATVMKTVDLAAKILQGPGGGGLFGTDTESMSREEGNLGATNASVYKSAAKIPTSGSDMLARATQYESAINSVRDVAFTASTTAKDLRSFCLTQRDVASTTLNKLLTPEAYANSLAYSGFTTLEIQTKSENHKKYYESLQAFLVESKAQADAVTAVFTTTIAPIFPQIESASTTVAAARALVKKIQDGLNSSAAEANTYTVDIEKLKTMSPTLDDVEKIQGATLKTQMAVATPPGSLNVSGGTFVDHLILISTNAPLLKASKCTVPVAPANLGIVI